MASEESTKMETKDANLSDLEDGEIEDDDEDEFVEKKIEKPESENSHKKKSPSKENNDSKKSSNKKDKSSARQQDEDDFMSSIESKIANVLKEKGVQPPMPSIKKPDPPEPEHVKSSSSRSSKKRRKRKERKELQKRESSSSKKRSKISDDNLYMVGGSPQNSGSESDHSYTSYSSYDSDDYHRSSYEERRNKRRDKYSSRSDRDRKDSRRNRDSEKEICLRFAEYGHCPDVCTRYFNTNSFHEYHAMAILEHKDDCQRLHEVRQPKKMELCKFWLMECCAKKDKCSYMHGDFPCKYYYLGLKCINKDCKFMHGKPLSDNLKQILLKHLDTAPKEILGDFPRIGRENATKMITQTHIKLCQEHNIALPESEKSVNIKIPSLLEMKLKPPPEDSAKNENRTDAGRTSRWMDAAPSKNKSIEPGDTLLIEMRGILTDKQIETMSSIGVKTVNHINNLTVSQINEIGLSLATIGEIQATAINMHSRQSNNPETQPAGSPMTNENNKKQDVQTADIDMRVFNTSVPPPLKSPDTIMSPNQSDMESHDNKSNAGLSAMKSIMMSPPSTIDYSQYLRDSNLNNDDEDEPSLKIDYASDCENETEEKKDSQSEDDQLIDLKKNVGPQLLPPSFDTSAYLNSASQVLSKVDISSSIQQLMEKASPTAEKVSHRDPRVRGSSSSQSVNKSSASDASSELGSPTYKDSSAHKRPEQQARRTSIYEIESPDEEIDIKLDKDKDMRVPQYLRDTENGDIDLRFPFAPMTNYIPATEIEASYGTHVFEKYEVKIVDIPKPDYSEIKKSFQKMDSIQDPRLKKLCGLNDSTSSSTSSASTSNLDPRKRKLNDPKSDSASAPKKLAISAILQNSKHYNELSSSQKMVVNQILAELSTKLKEFHKDKTPSKIFDTTFITHNPRLNQILIGLGVFVNTDGEFEELKDVPIAAPATAPPVLNLPNVNVLPPTIIPNILQQPPPNLMMQPPGFLANAAANLRPGLLGMAPPSLSPFNFDPQDFGSSGMINQCTSYGNEQNFNNSNNNRNQRSSSNNNNNNFRNNSHHRNNNYNRSNRR